MSETKPKREIIIDTIREGNKTAQDLMAAADCNPAGLASQFTYMRLVGSDADGGVCPIKDDDGIFTLVTKEEWEAIKADKKANAKTRKTVAKTPVERLKAAIKREDKMGKASVSYAKKLTEALDTDDGPSRELEIRAQLAELNYELAEMELEAANEACPDGVPEEVIEDDNVEETEDATDLA